MPYSHHGTVRYGTPTHKPEKTEEEEEKEEEEVFQRRENYTSMNRARPAETEEEEVHDFDQDDYVSIHVDNSALRHRYAVPPASVFPRQHDEGTTSANNIYSIPGTSPRLENGASQSSVPTFHAFPSEHEQRPISADDMWTTPNEPTKPPSWATLPRQNPPKIPERVDLMAKKVPNGEGAGDASGGRAIAEGPNSGVKRKPPVPTPRTKLNTSGTIPRLKERPASNTPGDQTSHENEPIKARIVSEEQGPLGAPVPGMGPSDNRVPPLGAENMPMYMPLKGPSKGDESIYERPWVDISNPVYDLPELSENLTSEPEHVYAQAQKPPDRPVGDMPEPGNHFYDLPNMVAQQGAADHIYERPDVLLGNHKHSTRPQSNTLGQVPASPPVPPKDIMSRDTDLETRQLPEPLRPVPLSPTSPTGTGGFSFTSGSHSNMTSSSASVRAATAPAAEEFYDRPFVLPPPPEIPAETLHRPPPEIAFDESAFFGDLDSSFSGMTLEFRQAHALQVSLHDEQLGGSAAPQDDYPSLGEEQQDCVEQVRAVWAGADVDWCCAALMECDGDLTRVLQLAKIEQVHCITGKEKEHCEFTLKHCNWDPDRAVNWILDEG